MQESDNLNATLSEIRSALMRIRGEAKTGAQLHDFILSVEPNLDIRSVVGIPNGPGALTKFIETYLSQIVNRIGMKGGDVLYGIGEDVVAPHRDEASASVWKAFVSPSAVNHLCLRTSDMKLVVSETLDLDEGTHHIPRITNDEHDAIRQEFRSSLTEAQRELLDEQVEPTSSYDEFVSALRAIGLMKSWGKYRRDAFTNLLKDRLKQMSIAGDLMPAVLEQLIAAQHALYHSKDDKPSRASTTVVSQASGHLIPGGSSGLTSARSLARSVIDNMNYEELRAIHMPFGAVLDALNSKK